METIKVIFLLMKFIFILGVCGFMFYKYKETDYKKLAEKNYKVVIGCLCIIVLELITGNPVGVGIWLLNCSIWMSTYFRYKRLS